MKIITSILAAALAAALSGCAGHLYTVVNPTLAGADREVKGIITYQPVHVIELYKTTILGDEKSGNVLGAAPEKCSEDRKMKFSTRADYGKPQLVGYAPGLLDKNKFGLTLKDGLITSVNSESDPVSGLKDLAAVLPFIKAPFAETKGIEKSMDKPLCNAGDKLIGLYAAPEVQPYEKMPQ